MSQSITGRPYRPPRAVSGSQRVRGGAPRGPRAPRALAVTDRDGLVASATFGHADLSARRPVAPETFVEHGSIGKTFTAVLLLQLHDEERVDLQAPVARYLPWFDVRSEYGPIALHHLLTHTAGIAMGSDASADSRFDVWALRETETGFAPGERFHYSNVGYRTLGYVLEELTGRPYPELVRERILEPLGMAATDPAVTSETRKRLAVAGTTTGRTGGTIRGCRRRGWRRARPTAPWPERPRISPSSCARS